MRARERESEREEDIEIPARWRGVGIAGEAGGDVNSDSLYPFLSFSFPLITAASAVACIHMCCIIHMCDVTRSYV